MSNKSNVTDAELMEFCKWYADFHGKASVDKSVVTTCLCGYFHTYSKRAERLLKRCLQLGLLTAHRGKVMPL